MHWLVVAALVGRIAFVRDGQLWLREAGQERQVPTGGRVHQPRFSPDGQFLLYSEPHKLFVARVDGAGAAELPAEHCEWSPVRNQLACESPQGVQLVTTEGQSALAFPGWHGAAWAPDGERLALVKRVEGKEPRSGTAVLGVARLDDREPKVIWQEPVFPANRPVGGIQAPRWSADGRWLSFMRSGVTASVSSDVNELAVLPVAGGTPVTLGETPANPTFYAWAPTGATIAYTDGAGREVWHDKQVRVVPMPPRRPFRSITPQGYADREPAWAPDGSRLAVSRSRAVTPERMDQPAPEQGIYVVDLKTGRGNKVGDGVGPVYGRDGSLLWVQPAGENRPAALWWRPAAGGAAREVVTKVDIMNQYYGQWRWRQAFDWWTPRP